VPKAKAVSQGPTFLPPSTNPSTLVECFLQARPTPIIRAKKQISIGIVIAVVVEIDAVSNFKSIKIVLSLGITL
jgi:hypothetical protein